MYEPFLHAIGAGIAQSPRQNAKAGWTVMSIARTGVRVNLYFARKDEAPKA